MQKKILLSLLMASPASLPALANIDYGHGDWVSEGLSGSDQVKIDLENGDVTCVLGSGPTKWVVKDLLPGTYKLSFDTVTNLSITVSQNGKTITEAKGESDIAFDIEEEGVVTITASGITANTYGFTGASLQLDFDFQKLASNLQTQLDGIDPYVEISDETYPGAEALLEEKSALETNTAGIQTVIDQLKNASTPNKDLEALYKDQKLYEDPSAIAQSITALAGKVKTWNEEATKLNVAIKNVSDNTAAKTNLLNEQKDLLTNIATLINKIKAGSQYGQQKNLTAAEALQKEIEAYGTSINTAYADDKLAGTITFESQAEALQTRIDSLQTEWEAAEADWNAYNTFMNTVYPALQSAADKAIEKINALEGVKGQEKVFDDEKQAAIDDVNDTFNEAKAALNITSAEGAAEKLEGDQKTVEEATAAIEKIAEDLSTIVTTQNTNKTKADAVITGFNTEFEDTKCTVVPKNLQDDYNSAVEDLETKISELTNYVNEQYGNAKLNLSETGYTDKVEAVENALADFKTLVEPIQAINELADDFADAKAHVKEVSDKLGTEFINLYGLFSATDGTFDAIDKAIRNLTGENVAEQKDAIEEAITDAITTADNLAEVFTQLQAADAQYQGDVTDLNSFVKAKVEIDKNGANSTVLKDQFMASTGKGGEFVAAQQKFNSDLHEIAAEGKKPQAIYNSAVTLRDDNIEGTGNDVTYKWEPALQEMKVAFAKQVTDSNKANLDLILDAAKEYVADGEYEGQDSLDFDEIDTKVADIVKAIADAATAKNPIEAYGDADNDIVNLIPDINAVKDLAEKYKQNQQDYDVYIAKLGTAQESIDDLIQQNEKESKDNGKDYFANLINGDDNTESIQAQLDTIQGNLDKALKAYADPEKNVTGQKSDFDAQITALNGLIEKTATDITNNNTAHTQQLNTAEQVSEYIVSAFNTLEEYYKDQTEIEDWYEETQEKLTNLRDEALFNNNLAVAQAYGTGLSYKNDATLSGAYEDIYNEVESIVNSMMDDYTKAVIKANNETVAGAKWKATTESMNAAYVDAISTFNSYYYGPTNAGWKEYIKEDVKRHEAIYAYSQQINDLIAEVNAFITDHNEAPVTFTAADFKEAATDKADALIGEINNAVTALNEAITAKAVTYYNEKSEAAETQITGYKTQLDNAGISDDCLTKVTAALGDAASKYENATADEETPLGLAMDPIADDLDTANTVINLQNVASDAWNAAYDEAKEAADTILSNLNDSQNEEYKFADSQLRESAAEEVAGKIQEMLDLNGEVAGVKTGLIDSYKDYKDQLDELLSDIEGIGQDVADDSANNKSNEDLYKTLTGTTIPDLEKALGELVEYASSLAGGQTFDTAAIQAQIDALKAYVESHTGSLATNKAKIESDCAAIETAITDGYPQIGYNEYDYLNETLLGQVKVAFNDAKAAFLGSEGTTSKLESGEKGTEQLNDWNDQIDELAGKVTDLNEMIKAGTTFDKDKFQTEAQALEAALTDLYVTLEQTWTSDNHDGNNPATEAVAALEEQYDSVKEAISVAKDYLGTCEEGLDTSDFETALNEAADALDAEKADWESVGNRVVSMQPTYADAMEAINTQVEKTLEEAKKANDQAVAESQAKAANQQAYTTLSADLQTLKDELNRVAELANSWYEGDYSNYIEYLSGLIEDAEENLNTQYENVLLTAASTLLNGTTISEGIEAIERNITMRYAKDQRKLAADAITDAKNALNGHLVPEDKAPLQEKLGKLQDAYDSNYERQVDTANPPTIADNYEIIAEYERIAEEAGEIQTSAEENSYVPGDVDLNPDGLVTAADVQTLIRWVLEGMTWQDLLAENPRQAYAADLNDDQDLNITDVTMDISLMFGESPAALRAARLAAPAAAVVSQNVIGVELVGEENGVRRYAVMLSNTDRLIAGQIDLKLPGSMSLKAISTAERTAAHTVESLENGLGTVRAVLYSMENATIEGQTGAILYVDVEGYGDLKTDNVIFTDHLFNTVEMPGTSDTNMIDSIIDGVKEMGTRIYNAAGMMFDKLQKGINIFRDKDGKVKKQYNRN